MMQKSMPVLALAAGAMAAGCSCPSDSTLSCHNTTVVADTCCFIPAGQLVQTQFWSTKGPSDSWTIHGLWPNNCDGSYRTRCDADRAYTNVTAILQANGANDTLDYMKRYWKHFKGEDERFWEREWRKHGTCVTTLEPSCYGDAYRAGEEAADFFTRTVGLFKTLPTYQWLADAGIEPSDSKTYDAAQIQSVLAKQHGAEVTLRCSKDLIYEVWYHFNVRGSLQDGEFVAAAPEGVKRKCTGQIRYAPKPGRDDL
ncbi:hypothetical protein MY11210_006712 [Beauveria gryllotalpidicola]